MNIHLVSFSTTYKDIGYPDTELRQFRLVKTANQFGIHSFFTWNRQKLIRTPFFEENKYILDQKLGAGYWLWKPYIIYNSLQKINENDILIYSDNAFYFIDNIEPLIELCKKKSIILFKHTGESKLKKYVQKNTFIEMNLDYNEYKDNIMCGAGIQIYKKNNFTMNFVKEYLTYCKNPNCLMENYDDENPVFRQHKHDMSILSLLVAKYNIDLFRIPYQHGNQHKMQEYRKDGEFIIGEKGYHDIDFNSHYPTILYWDKEGMTMCKRPLIQKANPVFWYYKLKKTMY